MLKTALLMPLPLQMSPAFPSNRRLTMVANKFALKLRRNYVAKNAHKANKASVMVDRKKAMKRGEIKHKGDLR